MALARGRLVVKAGSADGRWFQAHLVGGPTSKPATECGGNVGVTASLRAIQTLMCANETRGPRWNVARPRAACTPVPPAR